MQKYKTACAIIVNKRDEILLIKRGREPHKDKWALVSGIGESKKGLSPETAVMGEVSWDLGTDSFKGEKIFSIPVKDDDQTDEVIVFLGEVNQSEIKLHPGHSSEYKWVLKKNLQEFTNLAFDHEVIIKKYLHDI